MRNIGERIGGQEESFRRLAEKIKNDIRVAIPGIVQSFDPVEQTVTVQSAIRERIRDQDGNMSFTDLPLLLDVPVMFPRAGGFVLTMPVVPGDECLVIFGDMCIDAWWSNGGVQNQIEKRRHDLSDGLAIMGVWSQPRVVSGYSTNSAQLRTEDGSTCIDIKPEEIGVTALNVSVTAADKVIITGTEGVTINGKTASESW
jgi:ribosomal protein L18E